MSVNGAADGEIDALYRLIGQLSEQLADFRTGVDNKLDRLLGREDDQDDRIEHVEKRVDAIELQAQSKSE